MRGKPGLDYYCDLHEVHMLARQVLTETKLDRSGLMTPAVEERTSVVGRRGSGLS